MLPRSACQFPRGGVAFSSEFPDDDSGLTPQIYLPIFSNGFQSTNVASSGIAGGQPIDASGEVSQDEDIDHGRNITHQTTGAAMADDIAIFARQADVPLEDATTAISFQQAFSRYVEELLERYPDQFTTIYVEPAPSARGHIQFVGKVPQEVVDELARGVHADLGDSALSDTVLTPANLIVTGDGVISMDEHRQRTQLVAIALLDAGYQNHVVFFEPQTKLIQIELQLPKGTKAPTKSEVFAIVRDRIASDVELRENRAASVLKESDLELTIFRGDGPMIIDTHARGGNWMLRDGNNSCTSGFTVEKVSTGVKGVSTAGHCEPQHQFREWNTWNTNGPVWNLNQSGWHHVGSNGDIGWYTTPHIDLPEFFAHASIKRSVNFIKPTSSMVGQQVCMYGRASNNRTCNHTIESTGATATSGGITTSNLARATNNSSIGGDSGTAWTWDTTAFGIQKGFDGAGKVYFTPANRLFAQFGVIVQTSPVGQ